MQYKIIVTVLQLHKTILNIFAQNVNILIQNGATDRRLAPYLIKQKQPLNLAGFSNGGCFCLCLYVLRLHACGLIVRSSPQSFQLQLRFQKLQEQTFVFPHLFPHHTLCRNHLPDPVYQQVINNEIQYQNSY